MVGAARRGEGHRRHNPMHPCMLFLQVGVDVPLLLSDQIQPSTEGMLTTHPNEA